MNPRIYVTRKSDPVGPTRTRFILHVLDGRRIAERVTAASASLIWDYLENNWPVGTRAQWIIL